MWPEDTEPQLGRSVRCETRKRNVTYSSLLEKVLARFFPGLVASLSQVWHVNECRTGEHDCLEQDQANFAIAAVRLIDDIQKVVQVQ